jgi:hypothetical protein
MRDDGKSKYHFILKKINKYSFAIILIVWIVCIYISEKLWRKSLKKCDMEFVLCVQWMDDQIFTILLQIFLFSALNMFVLTSALFVKKPLKYLGIGAVLANFGIKFVYSNGTDIKNHSKINFQAGGVSIILLTVLILWIYMSFKIYKKNKTNFFVYIMI